MEIENILSTYKFVDQYYAIGPIKIVKINEKDYSIQIESHSYSLKDFDSKRFECLYYALTGKELEIQLEEVMKYYYMIDMTEKLLMFGTYDTKLVDAIEKN